MTPDGIEDAFEVSSVIVCNSPINKPALVVDMTIGGLINIIQQNLASKSAHNKS